MPTRSYDRYEEGDVLSAARLRDEFGEVTWLAGLEATPPLYLEKAAGNPCIWIDLPNDAIMVKNIGGSDIPENGVAELVTFHEDTNTWDCRVAASPGPHRVAVATAVVKAGQTGMAYDAQHRGKLRVLVAAGASAGMWAYAAPGTATAQWVRDYAELFILGLPAGSPDPTTVDKYVLCRFE